MSGGEHVCARCPRALGRSCCEPREGEHLCTLTHADVARIQAETGLAPRRFVVEEPFPHDEQLAYERLRPLYRGYFRARPVRLTLARGPRGACVFHREATGCTLSADARPTACRLYPLEWGAHGDWLPAASPHEGECLALDEAASLEDVARALGLSGSDLDGLRVRLLEEVHAHGSRRDGR